MQILPEKFLCRRFFCAAGGLFGAAGIAAMAAATHIGGYYGTFAPILLGTAPLFIAIAFSGTTACLPRLGGGLIFLGAVLFSVSLLFLQHYGHHFFPYSAPLGGMLMILGWLLFIPAAFRLGCGCNGSDRPTLH